MGRDVAEDLVIPRVAAARSRGVPLVLRGVGQHVAEDLVERWPAWRSSGTPVGLVGAVGVVGAIGLRVVRGVRHRSARTR